MDLNFFGKMINTFAQPIANKISANFKIEKKKILTENNDIPFHTDCRYTRKKVCYCRFTDSKNNKVNFFVKF
jgi:hypothetical protein